MPVVSKHFTSTQDKFIIKNRNKMTWGEIGDALGGIDREKVRKRFITLTRNKTVTNIPVKKVHQTSLRRIFETDLKEAGIYKDETEKGSVIRAVDPQIRTVDDLVRVCKIDLEKWHIVRATVNAWGGFAKTSSRKIAPSHYVKDLSKVTIFQVKIHIQPRENAIDLQKFRTDLLRAVVKESIKLPSIIRPRFKDDAFMYEISIPDHHFGKLAWREETGESYDLSIATERYKMAIIDFLSRASYYPIEKIHLPTGNDLFHIDSMTNVTTAGTPQDVDGRWQKSFVRVYETLVWTLKACREVAPTEVKMIPGNHDYQRVFYLGEALKARFHDTKDIVIDNRPTSRKYTRYGNTLIGWTHGDNEKPRDLPSLMAHEQPEDWALSLYRIWHTAHLHQQAEQTIGGVNIRTLPSLCGSDAWHSKKGFTMGTKLAEAHRYHKITGLHSIEIHTPSK